MIERSTLSKVSNETGLPVVALPKEWDAALVGYTLTGLSVVAAYDYDLGRVHFGDSPEDYDDRLLDAVRLARIGTAEPLIIHTRNN